jgi:hypothetical protein
MSVRFRFVTMLEKSVSSLFARWPEEEDAPGRAGEARPIDGIRLALEDGCEQLRIVARVVFEIRVLDQHDVPGRLGEAAPQGGALPLVRLLVEDADLVLLVRRPQAPGLGQLGLEPPQVVSRAVPGAVIDDDDLLGENGDRLDALQDLGKREPLVVDGNDDGEARGGLRSHRRHYSRAPPAASKSGDWAGDPATAGRPAPAPASPRVSGVALTRR